MRILRVRSGVLLAGALVSMHVVGCAGPKPSPAQYVPDATSARSALEKAFAAWQRGDPVGRIETVSPAIEVVDTKRPAGKLAGFEILKEESGDGPRWFTVRLKLESGDEQARYAVVGRDPIWVFSEADYLQIGSM